MVFGGIQRNKECVFVFGELWQLILIGNNLTSMSPRLSTLRQVGSGIVTDHGGVSQQSDTDPYNWQQGTRFATLITSFSGSRGNLGRGEGCLWGMEIRASKSGILVPGLHNLFTTRPLHSVPPKSVCGLWFITSAVRGRL